MVMTDKATPAEADETQELLLIQGGDSGSELGPIASP
jgi:hypothetical protein